MLHNVTDDTGWMPEVSIQAKFACKMNICNLFIRTFAPLKAPFYRWIHLTLIVSTDNKSSPLPPCSVLRRNRLASQFLNCFFRAISELALCVVRSQTGCSNLHVSQCDHAYCLPDAETNTRCDTTV